MKKPFASKLCNECGRKMSKSSNSTQKKSNLCWRCNAKKQSYARLNVRGKNKK